MHDRRVETVSPVFVSGGMEMTGQGCMTDCHPKVMLSHIADQINDACLDLT